MTRKREPIAEIGAEDYRIVRHTHDVVEAASRMRALLGDHSEVGCCESEGCYTTGCTGTVELGKPRQVWMRIVPCLPGTQGAYEGWKFQYHDADGPGRGAFPAVVFS